ncbi:Leucine Rich Repeat [Seminavis robusta]|uniref:Leucine Rich Repeat n=1 Tax=Seminavis robusta TaxID=568900 RepID=A0A9N8E315_9STRA|nr:Leucine Rich Repeat [Seminavis robusta]|eukprot:Sro493_g154020.1 Leucine Rich Repeat (718) ;mRNA; f:11903-14792
MSNNNNNNNDSDDDDVDLLKIVELRLQLGDSENCQENESKQAVVGSSSCSSSSPTSSSRVASAAAPTLPPSTTTSDFNIMKIVRERADAAHLETAGDFELVELTEQAGTTSQMSDNRNKDDAQVPLQKILTRQSEYSGQKQRNPGAYVVDGPGLANDRENHSNSSSGTSEEGLDNWVEEIPDDEVIAHPMDNDQQTGLLPNAEPLSINQRSRHKSSPGDEILVLTSKQGNGKQLPNQNESTRIPASPVEVAASAQTFLESLNLPRYTQEALANSRSPQFKAYQWLVNSINNQTFIQPDLPKWRLIQRFTMATFYYSTRGDYWVKNRGWLDWETNECSWEQIFDGIIFSPEVICNDKGEIKALAFTHANSMEGAIPPEISLLGKSLQSIKVIWQLELRGTIPTEFGLLTQLTQLTLAVTNIAGSIPTELGQLQSLQILHLSAIRIHGQIPSEIGRLRNLSEFAVTETDLTGSVPRKLYKLPDLQSLTIRECPGLETEYILQEVVHNAIQLRWLSLSKQSIGTLMPIPSEIGTLTQLRFLCLENWNLHGTLPKEIGKLGKLATLMLSGSSISGTLPPILLELTNLAFLYLVSNKLEGILPPDLFSILTNLQELHINDNLFLGTIPMEVGQLSDLWTLKLQNTNLSGTLPTEILMLENLASLVVTDTSLSGSIPEELCNKLYQQETKCYGGHCKLLPVKSNTTVCHGTSLCGCDCGPCQN